MSVARITEISAESTRSFEDAIRQGIKRANQTLRNVKGAWVKEQQVHVEAGNITTFRVNMLVTFVLEDAAPAAKTVKAAAPRKAAKKAARRR